MRYLYELLYYVCTLADLRILYVSTAALTRATIAPVRTIVTVRKFLEIFYDALVCN